MINALLGGALATVPTTPDPVFGVHVPGTCPGVPAEVLNPRSTWADKAAYDMKAKDLAQRFAENFKQFADKVDAHIAAAGPRA